MGQQELPTSDHPECENCEQEEVGVMNVSLMEYMCTEYDNLTSLIEASETRIRKEIRDETDRQSKEAEEMESR